MFDDIVVGAGSAGCALAARLSEDLEVSVALVEAGPADTVDEVHIPAVGRELGPDALAEYTQVKAVRETKTFDWATRGFALVLPPPSA